MGPFARSIETGATNFTRKRKFLEKQKEMRQFDKVDIPQEAFIAVLKVDN